MGNYLDLSAKIEDTFDIKLVKGTLMITLISALYDDDENTQQAKLIVSESYALIAKSKLKKVKMLSDLRPMVDRAYISNDSKKIFKDFVNSNLFKKIAIIGSLNTLDSTANFVLMIFGRLKGKNIRWFSSYDKANSWLEK